MLLINWWRGYFTKQFQKKVANYVIRHSNEISAVIAYDTFSEVLFDILQRKAPHIVKIIDHAHPSRYYLRDLYRTIDSGPFRITYEKECREYHTKPKVAEEYKDEIQKADYHLVASSFSKQAAIYTGVSETKIAVCPYGANKKSFKRNGNKDYFDTLKILFVGAVNQRKGIYQLLTAAKDLSNLGLEFNIVGTGRDFCKYLYKPYEKYVNFHGRVPFQKLLDLYDTNHIFVFPSLGEGYGMVIQEALSAGLPVITTPNCAGRDVITDGFNGFVVEAGSSNALKEKIIWFNEHRKELESMSINAEHSVKEMTWEQYGDNLVNILNNWLSE
jgi:glycosyltransferase involved in cell wall biosynthesis